MSQETKSSRPAFSAPLYAAIRQGAKEFAPALQAFPDSIRPIEEPGTLGNPTQQIVTDQMGFSKDFNRMLNEYSGRGIEQEPPGYGIDH